MASRAGILCASRRLAGAETLEPALVYVSLSEQNVRRIRYTAATSAPVVPDATSEGFVAVMPNPVRETTSISYSLERDQNNANLAIYDTHGRRVATLKSGFVKAGHNVTSWDRRDSSGERVASGVYFVSLEIDGGRRHTRKVTVLE